MRKTFTYTGPAQSVPLREPAASGEGTEIRDVAFEPGGPVELLPDHPVTIAFQAAGFLEPAPDADAPVLALPAPAAPQE